MKLRKNAQKYAIKFDRWCKNAKHRFNNKYTMNSGIRGGYSVLVNYQSLLSNIFPLSPPPHLFFFIKWRRNRLLRVSFIEQQDFMIYQHVNKKITMLS